MPVPPSVPLALAKLAWCATLRRQRRNFGQMSVQRDSAAGSGACPELRLAGENLMARLPRIAILSAVALFTWSGFAGAQSPGPNPPPAAGARAAAPASPCLTISPQSLYFGEQRLGTESPPQAVTLTNQSNSKVDLGLSVSGDFELMTPPAAPLAAGKSTAAVVRFKPGREGTAPGVLTLTVRSGCTGGQMVRLWGITPGWLGVICSNARLADILLAAALCLLYWLAMVVVRW